MAFASIAARLIRNAAPVVSKLELALTKACINSASMKFGCHSLPVGNAAGSAIRFVQSHPPNAATVSNLVHTAQSALHILG